MTKEQLIGSQTAKGGFANERDVVSKFNNWREDIDAQKWLMLMDYNLSEIEYIKAVVLPKKYKSDVSVEVRIKMKMASDVENIQVKLVSNPRGFNQVDKRPVDTYNEKLNWNIPQNVISTLKRFTGEIVPTISNPRDSRRMFIDEFSESERGELFNFLRENKSMIMNDILRGRGEFAVEWFIVAQKVRKDARWVLKNINEVINYYDGEIKMSAKGSVKIGRITMQKKGGTPDPESLQFKINPAELFETNLLGERGM